MGRSMERGMAEEVAKLTYDDFLLFPDDGKRHELIDGVHFVSPSPSTRHQRVLQRMNRFLDRFVTEHESGEVFFAPFDVVLSMHDVVEPDLLFVSRESHFVDGKPIRGGVPLIFPWFGPNTANPSLPAHGFARTRRWELAGAETEPDRCRQRASVLPIGREDGRRRSVDQ